jgi:hypothetical protein
MKFLFFILSCFMLYMSCLPCGDANECSAKSAAKISATNNHQQHNHEKESCTPFCICSCCAASVFFVPVTKAAAVDKVAFQSVKYPIYTVPFNAEIHYTIWQPPQIS